MSIKYVSVQEKLKKEKVSYPEFGVFCARGNVIKIAQWQPAGELSFLEDKGFCCKSDGHAKKGLEFLKSAVDGKADLVITPEYSLPWEVLEDILLNRTVEPKNSKLWCLGMEGISYDDLEAFYKKYSLEDSFRIIIEDLDSLNQKSFCSCIVYLFRADKKVICLIQLKTTAASDQWVELESGGLTIGNSIYYFMDKEKRNCLFSYICADALNQDINKVKDEVMYHQCIIVHPQLNPQPLHESFCQMRRNFFDYSQHSIRMIAVNWSKGTTLKRENKDISIEESYSAFYDNKTVDDDILAELIKKNKIKGVNLAKERYISIWYMPSEEHAIIYSIDGFRTEVISRAASGHIEPIGDIFFEYDIDNEQWQKKSACSVCSIDWDWLKNEFQIERCKETECCIIKLHRFFEILFIQGIFQGLELHDGLGRTVFVEEYKNSEDIIRLRERGKYINAALKNDNIPDKFSHLKKGNYEWILDERGNLTYKNDPRKGTPLCIAYVDCENEDIIKKKISAFENMMGREALDRLLVYFITEKGLSYYDKFYNMNINNPVLTHPNNLFKDGKR